MLQAAAARQARRGLTDAPGGAGGTAGAPQESLWYFIELDPENEREPLRRRGPFTVDEFRGLWKQGKLTEESYVWAAGMDDFKPLKGVGELLGQFSAGGPAAPQVDFGRASWYYKDKMGVKLGPSVLDTMKIMWDFKEVDENTLVHTDGMDDFKPICELPELHKALATGNIPNPALPALEAPVPAIPAMDESISFPVSSVPALPAPPSFAQPDSAEALSKAEQQKVELSATKALLEATQAELKVKEATLKAKQEVRAGAGLPQGAGPRSPWTPPPPRPAGDLTESEFDEDDEEYEKLMSSVKVNLNREVPRGAESVNPMFRQKPKGASPAAKSPGGRPVTGRPLTTRAIVDEPVEQRAVEESFGEKMRARFAKDPGEDKAPGFQALPPVTWSTQTPQAAISSEPVTQQTIYSVFKSEMKTLEDEYRRCRDKLEREYESRHAYLTAQLVEEHNKVKHVNKQYQRVKDVMEDDIAQLEQEQRRLQLLEQQLAEAQTRVNSEVEVMRLKLEEDNVKTAEYLDQQKAALESEQQAHKREKEAIRKEYDKLDTARQAVLVEKRAIEEELEESRAEMMKGREKVDDDIKEFDVYKKELEKLHDTRQLILQEEQEEFIKNRAVEMAKLQDMQTMAAQEIEAAEERLADLEKQRTEIEYDNAQRSSYLDIHQKKLEEDRKSFETYRAQMEGELEAEREKLKEHIRALEARETMNSDLLDTDRRRLLREKESLAAEVEAERSRLEEQRIEQARKTMEMQQQIRKLQDQLLSHGYGFGTPLMRSAAPTPGGMASMMAATPSAKRMATPAAVASSSKPGGGLRCYVNVAEPNNLLGEVSITSTMTLGALRKVVQSRFGLPTTFKMKRRKVPIRAAQDHHLARDFFKDLQDDYLVVDY